MKVGVVAREQRRRGWGNGGRERKAVAELKEGVEDVTRECRRMGMVISVKTGVDSVKMGKARWRRWEAAWREQPAYRMWSTTLYRVSAIPGMYRQLWR